MGMFLPENLANRIIHFIEGKIQFPFIRREELMGIFFIFGKNHGLSNNKYDVSAANDLAKRTVASLKNTVFGYHTSATARDFTFIRHNYSKRVLQVSVELNKEPATYLTQSQMNSRIAGDPRILTDCYSQHVAHFQQDQIFEIFQPLNADDLPSSLKKKLENRMILLGYNVKDKHSLPHSSTTVPFFRWLAKVDT